MLFHPEVIVSELHPDRVLHLTAQQRAGLKDVVHMKLSKYLHDNSLNFEINLTAINMKFKATQADRDTMIRPPVRPIIQCLFEK